MNSWDVFCIFNLSFMLKRIAMKFTNTILVDSHFNAEAMVRSNVTNGPKIWSNQNDNFFCKILTTRNSFKGLYLFSRQLI